jgi:ABC-type cobalt transport system substrate-binding protein
MSSSLQLQKEVLLELFFTTYSTPSNLVSLIFRFKGQVGVGVLGYIPTPLGRKSGKREHRESSVSHIASSTEWLLH